jgi:pimeloyl-ACP methyl ester carboxylesterase
MEDLMLESLSAAREHMAQNCTLDGVVERIAVPYLVIHGARDDLLGVEEGRQMAAGPLGEFVNFEDGFHTCTNYNAELTTLMCDWMAEKLEADGPAAPGGSPASRPREESTAG